MLLPEPPDFVKIIEGEAFEYKMGEAFDADGDEVTVKYDLKRASSFINVIDDLSL